MPVKIIVDKVATSQLLKFRDIPNESFYVFTADDDEYGGAAKRNLRYKVNAKYALELNALSGRMKVMTDGDHINSQSYRVLPNMSVRIDLSSAE